MASYAKSSVILSSLVFLCYFMTGCASFTVSNYGVSTDNVLALKKFSEKGQKISVGEFTAAKPGEKTIFCRGAGNVKVSGEHSFESYIREAFINELKLGELYDPKSETEIKGFLDEIEMGSFNPGKWRIRMTFSSQGKEPFSVESVYEFPSHWIAEHACQKVAQEFVPAVQKFIKTVIEKQEFQDMMRKKM